MKIDSYDSQKLDNLKDDILRLVPGVDGYKERTAEICTVLRNVQDTLAPDWFQNEVRKRIEEEEMWAEVEFDFRRDALAKRRAAAAVVQQEKNDACEKLFATMRINEDSVRSLPDEDAWRLLDNRERSDKRSSQRHSLQALDPEAQDKRMRECAILNAELDRRGGPLRPYPLYEDDDLPFRALTEGAIEKRSMTEQLPTARWGDVKNLFPRRPETGPSSSCHKRHFFPKIGD
jgi:hypothetical protein